MKASLKNDSCINLGSWIHPSKYKISKVNIDRYLWLATRMGRPTIKDGNASGLERIPIYNITKCEQIFMTYDIFISYKRKSLVTANNLYYRLTTRGYSTSFDLDEMKKDNFDVQLLHYVENAKDVFIILEEGSLYACKSEEWNKNWFCKEVAHAIKTKRNIIPVLLGGGQI